MRTNSECCPSLQPEWWLVTYVGWFYATWNGVFFGRIYTWVARPMKGKKIKNKILARCFRVAHMITLVGTTTPLRGATDILNRNGLLRRRAAPDPVLRNWKVDAYLCARALHAVDTRPVILGGLCYFVTSLVQYYL